MRHLVMCGFTQERLANAADTGTTANVGIGYRRIAANDEHYYGGNLFYDHRSEAITVA